MRTRRHPLNRKYITYRIENAGVENAGVETTGEDSRGGNCRSGRSRSRPHGWNMQEKRTKPRSQVTCKENFVKFSHVVLEIYMSGQTNKQTNKQTDRHTDTHHYQGRSS